MNKVNLYMKGNYLSTFDFSTLYTKSPLNNLLMVINNLIYFYFNREEMNFITFSSYSASLVKDVKYNPKCFNKQQIKDAFAYFLFNCCFTLGPEIFHQIIDISMVSDPASFLPAMKVIE